MAKKVKHKKEDYYRKMELREWIENTWFYYKIHICGVLIVIYLIFSVTSAILRPHSDVLTVAWLAGHENEMVLLEMAEALSENMYATESDGAMIRDFHLIEGEFGFNIGMRTSFGTLISTREIDIVIARTGETWLEAMEPADTSLDIREFLEAAGLEVPEEFLLSGENYDGELVYYGVLLEGSPLLAYYGLSCENRYLAVVLNTARAEAVLEGLRAFWSEVPQ